RYQRLESIPEDQKMKMRRPVIVPSRGTDEIAHRTINWNWISGRPHAPEGKMALRVRHELPAKIHRRLFWILLVIEALRRGMPDIHFGALYRFAVLVFYPAFDEHCRPRRRRAHDGRPTFGAGCINPPKGPEQIGGRLGLPAIAIVEQTN